MCLITRDMFDSEEGWQKYLESCKESNEKTARVHKAIAQIVKDFSVPKYDLSKNDKTAYLYEPGVENGGGLYDAKDIVNAVIKKYMGGENPWTWMEDGK